MSVWLKIKSVEQTFWLVFWFIFFLICLVGTLQLYISCFKYKEFLFFWSFTPWPQIKHLTQQQKTINGFICIFLDPWLQFAMVSLAPIHPNFLFSLDFLSSLASQVRNKTESTKMDQDNNTNVCWRCSAVKSGVDAFEQLKLKFTSQIEEKNQEVQVKALNAFQLCGFEFYNSDNRSFPRQHTFALKCIKNIEFLACKVIRDDICLKSVTQADTQKKTFYFWWIKKRKYSLLCYDHFLNSPVPWWPKWWSCWRSSHCGGHG